MLELLFRALPPEKEYPLPVVVRCCVVPGVVRINCRGFRTLIGISAIARSLTNELTSVFVVSTMAVDSSDTVIVSAREPTFIRIDTLALWPSVTVTLERVTVENPFNSAFTVYVPDGRFCARNDPFSSDIAVRDAPVEFEVIVIK